MNSWKTIMENHEFIYDFIKKAYYFGGTKKALRFFVYVNSYMNSYMKQIEGFCV